MTVESRDLSNYDGEPVTLYEFWRRSVPTLTGVPVLTYWRYTSADRNYTLGSDLYTALAISDDGVRQAGDAASDQLTITMPASAAVPLLFVGSPPSDPIHGTIRRTHAGEADAFIVWTGLVGMVSRAEGIAASVVCNTLSATLDRTGLRLSWSRNCPHALYDTECRADPTGFYVTGTVSALTGAVVGASIFGSLPVGRLDGGFLEWIEADGHAERRGIVEHGGTNIRLLGTTDRITVGMTVYAFFGCNRTRAVCNAVFGNLVNFGGHAYMPDKSPFSGDLIF